MPPHAASMNATRNYTAQIDRLIDQETFDELCGIGGVTVIFRFEAEAFELDTRRRIVSALADEYGWRNASGGYSHPYLDRDFWQERLSRRNGNFYDARLPELRDIEWADELRGMGYIIFEFEMDAVSRAAALRALDELFAWRGFDFAFWDEHLSGRRARAVAA